MNNNVLVLPVKRKRGRRLKPPMEGALPGALLDFTARVDVPKKTAEQRLEEIDQITIGLCHSILEATRKVASIIDLAKQR